MSNRAEALIDLTAIAANVKKLKADSGTSLMAVVKADAYGHGLVPVANAALAAGADWLGVALVEEAHKLRNEGVTAPILAWLVSPGSDYAAAIAANIDLAVPSLDIFHEILATGKKARIHIEVDTGMTRGGFLEEWPEFLKSDFSGVEVVGIFSHFARADEVSEKQNQDQLNKFNHAIIDLAGIGIKPQIKHLANSAATLTNKSVPNSNQAQKIDDLLTQLGITERRWNLDSWDADSVEARTDFYHAYFTYIINSISK